MDKGEATDDKIVQTQIKCQNTKLLHVLKAIAKGSTHIKARKLEKILEETAHPADVYYQIGHAFLIKEQFHHACDYFAKAKAIIPQNETVLFALGQCYQKLNALDEAINYYQQVIAINTAHEGAYALLSVILYEKNDLEAAKKTIVAWIHQHPGAATAYHLFGSIFLRNKAYHDAITYFKQALQFDMSHYEAMVNLGQCYLYLGDNQQANTYLLRALSINDGYAAVHTYYGICQLNQRQFDVAKTHLEKAIVLDNSNALSYANLSVALQYLFCFGSGNKAMQQALRCDNTVARFYAQFAQNLLWQNYPEKAIKSCNRALQLDPNCHLARRLWGQAQLHLGNYMQAWPAYFIESQQAKSLLPNCPVWDGKPFPGKLLLVYWDVKTEEAILLMRYLPLLLGRYGRQIMVACTDALIPLFNRLPCVQRVVSLSQDLSKVSDIHLQVPISTLVAHLATVTENLPPALPDLSQCAKGQIWMHLLQRYGDASHLKIGVSTMGAASPDPAQTIPFTVFSTLVRGLKKADVFNLTPYQSEKQRQTAELLGIYDVGTHEYATMCAIIEQLDMVITSDNWVAHLACTLNKPVYVILPFTAKWYWRCHTRGRAWYPSARIYQQTIPKKWKKLIANILDSIRHDRLPQV